MRSKIMLIVFLSGMLVKSDLTSNDTNLNPSSNSWCGMLLICETASVGSKTKLSKFN